MVGLAASVLVGLAAPLLGVLISEMLADMVQQYTRFLASRDAQALVNTLRPLVMRHGFFLSAGAAVVVVFQSMQLFCLDAAAERVASQLRDLHFSSLLAQPVSFFDAPQHAPKLLVDALATQASTASLVVGRAQGYKLQIAVALVASLAVAFWRGSWMLTLVLLAALPLLLIGESIRAQYTLKTRSIPDRTESEEAVDVHVSEALRNRPTVVMLGLETSWCSSFDVLLQRPLRYTRHKAQLDAVARGFSGVVMVAACALTCWLSGVLVHSGDATFRELVRSLAIVLVSAQSLGLAVAWDARLLLLDEPTRSLGAEREKLAVQQALDTIVAQRVRRTTVIAAHPAESATVRNADVIYLVENGHVADQGTHSELLQFRDGVYARLLRESAWSAASSSSYTAGTSAT
ncbi:hypothetical protein PRNP1_011763 [Phytophthora ramorum]